MLQKPKLPSSRLLFHPAHLHSIHPSSFISRLSSLFHFYFHFSLSPNSQQPKSTNPTQTSPVQSNPAKTTSPIQHSPDPSNLHPQNQPPPRIHVSRETQQATGTLFRQTPPHLTPTLSPSYQPAASLCSALLRPIHRQKPPPATASVLPLLRLAFVLSPPSIRPSKVSLPSCCYAPPHLYHVLFGVASRDLFLPSSCFAPLIFLTYRIQLHCIHDKRGSSPTVSHFHPAIK